MITEFLRHLQLFDHLSEADLEWLSAQAEPVTVEAGSNLMEEGAPGDAAYIVMDGEFEVIKKSGVQNIVIAVRDPGAVIGEMALLDQAPRMATVHALRQSKVLKIRGETFQRLLSQSSTAALSILQTVSLRLRQNEGLLRQNEKMAALGTLSAGLAHELNNPAAAVRRSSDQLRRALINWNDLTGALGHLVLDSRQNQTIQDLKKEIELHRSTAGGLDLLTRSDRESELQSWLESHGIDNAWELAPAFVGFGWDLSALGMLGDLFDPQTLPTVLKWLSAGCLVYTLLDEVSLGAERISQIVQSVKAYSYLDQAPVQVLNVVEGLENTLVILRHKLKDEIHITRDYEIDLPPVEAYGSEINQVWTNILDNAIDALQGRGEIVLRTRVEEGFVVVEIQDNGPGIPAEIQQRIFDPFFTTKAPGKGTGLGLHIAYTIVNNHYGKIRVQSEPGKTVFRVALPIQLPR